MSNNHQPKPTPASVPATPSRSSHRSVWTWLRLLGGGILVAAAVFFLREHLDQLEHWLQGLGPWAPVAVLAAHAVLTVLFFPVSLVGVAAGALFGFWRATGLLLVAGLVTGSLMYGLGRWAFASWVLGRRQRSPRLARFLQLIEQDSVHIMVLLRLSPVHYGLINYLMGAGRVRFWPFLATTVLVLPSAMLQAYVGATARRLGGVADLAEVDTPQLILGAVGFLAAVLLVTMIGRKARRALDTAVPIVEEPADPSEGKSS